MRNLLEVCWGKSAESEDGERLWLPVWVHLLDTYATSQIVAQWMPYNCERILLEDLHLDRKELHDFIGWLSATHDLGKLTSGFYYRIPYTRRAEPKTSDSVMVTLSYSLHT